jgi:hypothetical protein
VDWKPPIFPYDVASGDDLKMDTRDSVEAVPKSVVVDPRFNWILSSNLNEELAAATKIAAAGIPIMRQSAQEPEESKTGKEKYSATKSKEDEAKAAPDLKRSTV